ncbi:MAG: hypothetical protein AAGA15_05500, partial [Pseudomonadota bacterium]
MSRDQTNPTGPQDTLHFPVNEEARERLAARPKRLRKRQAPEGVTRHPSYQPELMARIREEEKRRAMPEILMLGVLISVA